MPSGIRPDREVAAARAGGGFSAARSSADQRHANRLGEIARVARRTGMSTSPVGNTGVSPAGRTASVAQGMARDFRDIGNSPLDNLGNLFAGLLGFNEMPPSLSAAAARVAGTPSGILTDQRANWAFDPLGLGIGVAGTALTGVPVLPGLLGGLLSRRLGRPFNIPIGPSVFGGNQFAAALARMGGRL